MNIDYGLSALKLIPNDHKGPDDPCDLFEDCLVVAAPVYDRMQELSGAELEAFIGTLKVRAYPFKILTFDMSQWPTIIPYAVMPDRWGADGAFLYKSPIE